MARKFLCNDVDTVVQTKNGKLKGFLLDDIYTFHGIKYANAKRWQMPTPVEPWEGIKTALAYGYCCPMLSQDVPFGNDQLVPHRYWPMDEHCQYLNIWTQSLDPEAKKPVMVWIHGGGFTAGSSIEQVAYEGDSLCKFGDVVVVSMNHRLNILGYTDFSAFGEEYKNSCQAGNADLVAALQWVKENISAFGGDPDNVTIFGQSGGGSKVFNLMQIPAADGLFHKGIIMSSSGERPEPFKVLYGQEYPGKGTVNFDGGKALAAAMLRYLGEDEDNFDALLATDYDDLAEAFNTVAPEVRAAGFYADCAVAGPMDNDYYLGYGPRSGFTERAKKLPLMIGSVAAELAFGPGVEKKDLLTEEEREAMVHEKFTNSDAIIAAFRKAYPEKNLTDVLGWDTMMRPHHIEFIKSKAEFSEMAPTYSYIFAYDFPYDEGHPAWHCSDLPFVFHNTNRVPICGRPGVSDRLEEQMANAWVSFARYGNPNHPGIPQWDPATPGNMPVMIFDENCKIKVNADFELMEALLNTEIKKVGDQGHALH